MNMVFLPPLPRRVPLPWRGAFGGSGACHGEPVNATAGRRGAGESPGRAWPRVRMAPPETTNARWGNDTLD